MLCHCHDELNSSIKFVHREHTILLSRERVNKGMEILSPLVISLAYAILLGKPLLTNPAYHYRAKLVPRPFCTQQKKFLV